MPRISDERRAERRDQILTAAMRCVSRSGLAGTTMADIIAESGLSAGAVYTYFTSKTEILAAIAERQLGGVLEVFDEALTDGAAPEPGDVLVRLLDRLRKVAERQRIDIGVVATQVMAEAMLSSQQADIVRGRVASIRSCWTELARRWIAAGRLPSAADPDHVGAVLLGLLPGYLLQNRIIGSLDPRDYADGLTALMTPGPGEPSSAPSGRAGAVRADKPGTKPGSKPGTQPGTQQGKKH